EALVRDVDGLDEIGERRGLGGSGSCYWRGCTGDFCRRLGGAGCKGEGSKSGGNDAVHGNSWNFEPDGLKA
ncbi:MAG: hypothetical protein ABIM50_09115, partial [Novosphingobium sp.]